MPGVPPWSCLSLPLRARGLPSSTSHPPLAPPPHPPPLHRLVLSQNKKELLTGWYNEGKIEPSEELGDLVAAAGTVATLPADADVGATVGLPGGGGPRADNIRGCLGESAEEANCPLHIEPG